ncbi:MAG: energy transducer TonB [Bacteroidales bacterium]|nr:energy transducer TonB [Bacteroidales bacterium]
MKKLSIITLLMATICLTANNISAQNTEPQELPFSMVEQKPTFQGGDANTFTKWVFSQITYPEIAKKNGVQGRVTLQFTIDTTGAVTNIKVLRGVDSSVDKEAVRVISMSPKWEPGRIKGKPVNVVYTYPVVFSLK